MGDYLDELSKALASGASRRAALRRFAGGVAAAALAAFLPGRTSHAGRSLLDACKEWCRDNFGPLKERKCIKQAKSEQGPCYTEIGAPGFFIGCEGGTNCFGDDTCCNGKCCRSSRCFRFNGGKFTKEFCFEFELNSTLPI